MKTTSELLADIARKPCRLRIAGPSEDDPSEIYHGKVGEITEHKGILRIKIAEARKISTDDRQPSIEEPEFVCTDPENRLTVRAIYGTRGTDITLFNTPFVLSTFEHQESLDALEAVSPA